MKAGASLHIYLPSEIALAARNSADFARALRRALISQSSQISQSSHSAANENGCVSAAYAGAAACRDPTFGFKRGLLLRVNGI